MIVEAEVGVPWTNKRVYERPRKINDKVIEWFRDNRIPDASVGLKGLYEDEVHKEGQIGYYFGFADKNHALLFKLAWGGK